MKNIAVTQMGISTGHAVGQRRVETQGQPFYVLTQMLTSGYVGIGGSLIRMEPYECILIPPYTPRIIRPLRDSEAFLNNWCFFTGEDIDTALAECGVAPNTVCHSESPLNISDCFRLLFSEHIRVSGSDSVMLGLILRQIFTYMGRGIARDANNPGILKYRDALAQVRFDLYSKLRKDWKISDIARDLGVSVTWLNTIYRQNYGLTPKQDLMRARIEFAKELLSYSEQPLRFVASQCGFSNEYYFIRVFHNQTHMTPGAYRAAGRSRSLSTEDD